MSKRLYSEDLVEKLSMGGGTWSGVACGSWALHLRAGFFRKQRHLQVLPDNFLS
jgi:hypothetical protein